MEYSFGVMIVNVIMVSNDWSSRVTFAVVVVVVVVFVVSGSTNRIKV